MQSVEMVDRIESTVDRFESLVTQNSIVTATNANLRMIQPVTDLELRRI